MTELNSKEYYVNPLGNIKPVNYNDVSKTIKNYDTRTGQLKDSSEKIKLKTNELILWSSGLGISIIIFLVLLRNINN